MSTVRFLADHDLNDHIVEGVHRLEPALEILRSRELGLADWHDPQVLEYAAREGLVVVSHDSNTMTAAANHRLSEGLPLIGLCIASQSLPIRQVIESLVLIWSASELEDWRDQIIFLPL